MLIADLRISMNEDENVDRWPRAECSIATIIIQLSLLVRGIEGRKTVVFVPLDKLSNVKKL